MAGSTGIGFPSATDLRLTAPLGRKSPGLTKPPLRGEVSGVELPMNRLRLIVTVLLAALWLPATQHCGLEAAGLLTDQCAEGHGPAGCVAKADCASDECGTLEGGNYRSDAASLKVSPQWFTCIFLLSDALVSIPPESSSALVVDDSRGRPEDWVPSWQFERRAAAPAHAPDTLIA